jgi:minor extracellular serine protease Vpr
MENIQALDPRAQSLGQMKVLLNAVFVKVDASALADIAALPEVSRVAPVADYELDLAETVPYIGAGAVQDLGYDGTGIRVAVIDTGIDYYHANLGGSGDPNDYLNDDHTIIEPGTFPTAKVIGGYDFVGAVWPTLGPRMEDPDPLDAPLGAGTDHGTHVADIIAGVDGVAPGASLYALKVCSSVSTACSGIALMLAMEWAADPDGNGEPSDRADVINMSLGANYGLAFDDDLSFASDNASALGTVVVSSAGNGGDKPYVLGTPSSAKSVISVAQTQVPSAFQPLMEVTEPEAIARYMLPVWQPWSAPLTEVIEAPLLYGDGAGGNLLGCDPFAPGSLDGYIVLVNRGACNFTLKIKNIGEGGGLVGIIGLVDGSAPFAGGDGGDRPIDIPGYMISLADANVLRSGLPDTVVRFDPTAGEPLVGFMVGSSSRGPDGSFNQGKPEIGAPGGSVSAIAGTGWDTGPFGGTSGAAPMVSGSAALLLQAEPALSPAEVRARLVNTGETEIYNQFVLGGTAPLAPISRIGGGEVRVDRALEAKVAAWDDDELNGALYFGFVDVSKDTVTLQKKVRIRNYSAYDILYEIQPSFRFANDEVNGAVSVQAPRQVRIKAGRDAVVPVMLTIRGAMLRGNYMNSGSMGASGAALTLNEYDGYLTFTPARGSMGQEIHMPWHVLPRQAADVVGRPILNFMDGMDEVDLTNKGVGTAQLDAYAWIAYSENIPSGPVGGQEPTPDIRAVGVNTFPVPAGYCSANPSFVWVFAVNTWERQAHLLPVIHYFYLDTDLDGEFDFAILNSDAAGLGALSDGRQLSWAWNLNTGATSAFFFAEHSTNTGNTILYICGEQVGMNATNFFQNVDLAVLSDDFYYGGPGDYIDGLTIAPLGEQYYAVPNDIPGKGFGSMTVYDFGPLPGNTPELGVMLVTNGDRGGGARGGATQATEALLFSAP